MVSITADVELHIRSNTQWSKLPPSVKASLGNAPGLYDKAITDLSVKNQMRWRPNIVRYVVKDERKYYESLLHYSQEHLMLYPYHLQDKLIRGLRVTPFAYYSSMMSHIMHEEKSYDSLPNFTAADCLRLMGIGRNQYIDLMNQYRSKKFFRRRGIKDLLPSHPVTMTRAEPWWTVDVGFVTEDDIKMCTTSEHQAIDKIIDSGKMEAGLISKETILKLYNRGLIYFDIPIAGSDFIVVPPLQGFVMNRVQGDYFETLLYKIFVSIDEHTNIHDLASVLQVDISQVKDAVSVFIRLCFAYKKSVSESGHYHESWSEHFVPIAPPGPSPLTLGMTDLEGVPQPKSPPTPVKEPLSPVSGPISGVYQKRVGFLFDSTLTAFLMMGNLSPGLKNHAVTMFEVGKLADESMDSFIVELGKVMEQAEGEAKRYYEHAITLRNTLIFLRNNPTLFEAEFPGGSGLGVDMLRLESMASLDPATLGRLLQKNYIVLVSMSPLSQEVQSASCCSPPHLGPAVAEMNSIWFKLWLYKKLGCGPPSLLLAKGNRLRKLPEFIKDYARVLVTTWGHDPASVYVSNLLLTVNDALTHSAVLIQCHGKQEDGEEQSIAFPFETQNENVSELLQHPCLKHLEKEVDLVHMCGYITLLKTGAPLESQTRKDKRQRHSSKTGHRNKPSAIDKEKQSKITEFLQDMQELGIGDPTPPIIPPPSSTDENGIGSSAKTHSDSQDEDKDRDGGKVTDDTSNMSPLEKRLVSEWVPLELSFGIPLFNEQANKVVCDKILENKLLFQENLHKQTQANRLLALDVLNFISHHQDVPYFPEGVDGAHFSESACSPTAIPMPTRNLLFMDGTLTDFDS